MDEDEQRSFFRAGSKIERLLLSTSVVESVLFKRCHVANVESRESSRVEFVGLGELEDGEVRRVT